MKGFLYFLGGACVLTEISMLMRATNGLEEFSFGYIITMIIIGCLGVFFLSKASQALKSTIPGKADEEKVINENAKITNTPIEAIQKDGEGKLSAEKAVRVIQSRKLLKEPGKYMVKVINTVPYEREDGTAVSIVNYAAMTPYHVLQAKGLYDLGKYDEATNHHLSSFQRIGKDYQPVKDQFANIDIDWVPTKANPNIKALLVINCTEIKAESAPNVKFVNHMKEKSPFPAKPINVEESFTKPTIVSDKITLDLISTDNLAQLFIPLDVEEKAHALSIFFQIKHNNLFIDKLFESYSHLFNFEFKYDDFEEGYEFFRTVLTNHQINQILIINFLESVKVNISELCRLSAILSFINGDSYSSDHYLSLAGEAWRKSKKPDEFLYGFILIKTRADLLIYEMNYLEAKETCENMWDHLGLIDNEKISWLKYQLARTLIKISNHIEINFDVNILIEQLEQLEIDAQFENGLSGLKSKM
jgi:hypothetical protein